MKYIIPAAAIVLFVSCLFADSVDVSPVISVSDETQACLDCHESVSPGIVADWRGSIHSTITPAMSLKEEPVNRRMSATELTENLRNHTVGCYECHGLNTEKHSDSFDHFDFRINAIVSSKDCSTCHPVEFVQYSGSKKAMAIANITDNKLYHTLVGSLIGVRETVNGSFKLSPTTAFTENESCYGCHGMEIKVDGVKTVEHESFGEVEVPDIRNWPSQGVGRINTDGSRGSCTSCHPRHSFSLEIARKPETCGQCHLEPDVPAYNIYKESKHGNIYSTMKKDVNWKDVPWTAGEDFSFPSCATCHSSLVTDPEGNVIADRTHDFGSRLWVRLFGLIYSHPQPVSGNTSIIINDDGLPMPTTFAGTKASGFLISGEEQLKRQKNMQKICSACHSTDWSDKWFAKMDSTIAETDKMTATATKIMSEAWEKGLANSANPFDEALELDWVKQWLFYANSVRYSGAMSGPDYAAFKNGWWELTNNLLKMQDKVKAMDADREQPSKGKSRKEK